MKTVQLSGSSRANVGKKAARAVRNNGDVPCILYGSGKQTTFSVRSVDLEKLIFNANVFQVELDIDGTKKKAIIQDKQMHPLTDKPWHVDFLELSDDKLVKVNIPIRFIGRSKGVLNGGNLMTIFRTLKVKGLPKNLPDAVEVDISPLRIGDSIRVGELNIPGVETLENKRAVVVSVKNARNAIEDTKEEEGEADTEESTKEGTEGGSEAKETGSNEE